LLRRRFVASFVKGQVVLLAPQPALVALILLNSISVYYGAPVVVGLSALSSWFDYLGKAQRRGSSVLRKLERLVDDFGQLNFQKASGLDDQRIVRLLDKAVFPMSGSISPQVASAASETIRDVYFTLELWYFSMRQKVRLMLRRTSTIVEYDLLEVVNEFTDFYTEFVEKVAERTLQLVGMGDMTGLQSDRGSFDVFKTRFSELRGRTNAFLQGLHDDGMPISDTTVVALEDDPWLAVAQESTFTPDSSR
jgi:hypothetical protein